MVDATAVDLPGPTGGTALCALPANSGAAGTMAQTVSLDAYAELCREGLFAPAQSHAFISQWSAAAGPDHLIVGLWEHGKPVLALALDIARHGPFRVARFMGESHANGCFPACLPHEIASIDVARVRALMRAIGAARRDIDLVLLERMAPRLGEVANPLLVLPHTRSPNIALSTSLAGGFEAVLDRAGGKRKRKKHRAQTRKFETAGGYRIFRARTAEEVDRLWSAFLAMKELRFRKMGIANVFGEERIKAFFRGLFIRALKDEPPSFWLEALEVGETLRAVSGSSRSPGQVTCEFGAISEDDLSSASPGDFLFYEAIRNAAETGLAFYDFGVGDEPYKRVWCDTELAHADVAVPLTSKGRLLSWALRATARGKAAVKRNPALWRMVKRLRKGAAAPAVATEEDSASGCN